MIKLMEHNSSIATNFNRNLIMYTKNRTTAYTESTRGRGNIGDFQKSLVRLEVGESFRMNRLTEGQVKSKAVSLCNIGKNHGVKYSQRLISKVDGICSVEYSRVS